MRPVLEISVARMSKAETMTSSRGQDNRAICYTTNLH